MHATIVFARHLQGRPCPELEGVHRERTWWHQEVFTMNFAKCVRIALAGEAESAIAGIADADFKRWLVERLQDPDRLADSEIGMFHRISAVA